MAVLGLRFCARALSSCGEWGPLFIAVRGPLTIEASLLRSTGSRCAGSAIVAHGPSCPAACGIFPDQGSNPCPLHWQADSQPLRHQGSPGYSAFNARGKHINNSPFTDIRDVPFAGVVTVIGYHTAKSGSVRQHFSVQVVHWNQLGILTT